ncbi:hypothetical protein VNO78_14197 [Psophocarpus tetragonolobus]|uniref:Uncharacterized protein n=1 Tax=Psophocarpus tetragonolobus TaxID=3891 RepID=A0AAN9SSV8_PSOTE
MIFGVFALIMACLFSLERLQTPVETNSSRDMFFVKEVEWKNCNFRLSGKSFFLHSVPFVPGEERIEFPNFNAER